MPAITRDATPEGVQRQMVDELSENKLAGIHAALPRQTRESFRCIASGVQVGDRLKIEEICANSIT
jgi:hypothetical protein